MVCLSEIVKPSKWGELTGLPSHQEEEEDKEEEDPYPKKEESTPHLYRPVSLYPFIWPRTSKRAISFRFPHQNPMFISLLSHPTFPDLMTLMELDDTRRLITGIAGSKPVQGMYVRVLCLLCRKRPLRRADHSFREFLPTLSNHV